ncbi:MAG: peptidase MA family metallohydrolase [Dehalococcoidales bacterium]|nr:peptidase MA family metallohydrolase [Dehalococcoidales bacterium]
MIRKTAPLVLAAFMLLTLFSPGMVRAGDGPRVLDNSVQAEFPYRISFSLSADSAVDITDIRLCYRVDQTNFALVSSEVYIDFAPATSVSIDWALEMLRIGGLPPGSNLEYWWTVEDANGDRISTPPAGIVFDDNRYSWQSLTEGQVTMYWYQGDQSFAGELMLAAQQALGRLNEYTAAQLERPVKLYIYADAQDLRGSMIYSQEWTGGVAFTRYGIMAIGIAPDKLDWGRRAIAHELTHLVIHQVTLNPYNTIPTWLDEGLAMRSEGPLPESFRSYLDRAIAEGSLISVQSLASPFSAYTDKASLSYSQSYSLVEFLTESYGQDKMFDLLNTFQEGSTYDGALIKVYGFDMDGLDYLWQDWVTRSGQPTAENGLHLELEKVAS